MAGRDWDSGGSAPSANPFEGQLMAHQSQINLLKGELRQAVALIQNIPSWFDFRSVQQDLSIGKAQMKGMCSRIEALEKANAAANKRADEAEAQQKILAHQMQMLMEQTVEDHAKLVSIIIDHM